MSPTRHFKGIFKDYIATLALKALASPMISISVITTSCPIHEWNPCALLCRVRSSRPGKSQFSNLGGSGMKCGLVLSSGLIQLIVQPCSFWRCCLPPWHSWMHAACWESESRTKIIFFHIHDMSRLRKCDGTPETTVEHVSPCHFSEQLMGIETWTKLGHCLRPKPNISSRMWLTCRNLHILYQQISSSHFAHDHTWSSSD